MDRVDINCPKCGKLITVVSSDSDVTVFGYCRRCKKEYAIKYRRAKSQSH